MEVNCPNCNHLFETRLAKYPEAVQKNCVYGGWKTTEKTRITPGNQKVVQILCVCIKCKKEKWLAISNIVRKFSCRDCSLKKSKKRFNEGS